MARLTIREIFEQVAKAPTVEEKVVVLRNNGEAGLYNYLKAAFDPTYEWDLPEGMPPTKIDKTIPEGYAHNNMRAQSRLLYIFEKKYQKVNRTRKEMLFIDLLEGLYYKDADLIVAIKDRQLPNVYAGLNEELVRIAFPGLLTEPKRAEEILDPR